MQLKELYEDVQNISEAISSVIKVDVTIIDHNLERIAGTGRYKEKIGESVGIKSAFGYALKKAKAYIIEDPGKNFVCDECEKRGHCTEFAEVCCPILIENEAIGVIGLIAFDENQKERICYNQRNLMYFLKKMADLISSKYLELKQSEVNKILLKELEAVLNSVEDGIIAFDYEGKVLHYNNKFVKLLHVDEAVAERSNMKSFFKDLDIEEIVKKTNYTEKKAFEYDYGDKVFRGYYEAKSICQKEKKLGVLVTITNTKDMLNMVNNISTGTLITRIDDIKGQSTCMTKVKDKAIQAAKSNSTVLIQGESGTGKELFARAIHFHSHRAQRPFIAINCAAIPEQLLESELFGYESGAFTGAKKSGKAGKFELARKGTLFLDEIGDMPLHLQTKLLRVLQEKTIEKIGGTSSIPIDIRIIAATNRDLEKQVAEGAFRSDLYYRLNVIPIKIPPLRMRPDDLDELIDFGLKKFNDKLDKQITKISDRAKMSLKKHAWEGNVRELENVLEYAINMCKKDKIDIEDLPSKFRGVDSQEEVYVPQTLDELEKSAIEKTMNIYANCPKKVEEAAKALGISRATLYRKLKKYKMIENEESHIETKKEQKEEEMIEIISY
ncbi:MAG: sigma 54-interacting transcriptional regulator [Tissierellales bacterium]|jgi:transcriptional regulator with PAS, ATPase and Fis domain|nr:sigma 54-interacting transcriptional regulator [Tissierellales bacterium]